MNKRGFLYVPSAGGGGGGTPGGADTQVQFNAAGAFAGDSGFTFNSTNNTIDLGGATVVASDPILDLSQTWNNVAVTFDGIKLNITDTASAAASKLMDLQIGGISKFTVAKNVTAILGHTALGAGTGQLAFVPSTGSTIAFTVASNGSAVYVSTLSSGVSSMLIRPNGVNFGSNGQIAWTSGVNNPSTTLDLYLERGAAGTLVQRNGVNTQKSEIYNTYTDVSNYERLALIPGAASGWMQIAAQTAGTGTDNIGVALTPTGTGAISAHVPDSAAAGGNTRGVNAVDWSTSRATAAQVASGQSSVLSGGLNNTASGFGSVVGGGYTNAATANYSSVAGGETNTANGIHSWVPGGYQATARGLRATYAYSAGQRAA